MRPWRGIGTALTRRLPTAAFGIVAVSAFAIVTARAQEPAFLVKDINTTPAVREPFEDEPSSYPHDFAVLGGVVYFAAGDVHDTYGEAPNGIELWRSDGTPEGTFLVKDILPGPAGSEPRGLQVRDGALYFLATDSEHGVSLWRSDGTAVGTERLAASGKVGRGRDLTRLGSTWLFILAHGGGTDVGHGTELWSIDYAHKAEPIAYLSSWAHERYFDIDLRVVAGTRVAYFIATGADGSELWRTDGSAAGTARVSGYPSITSPSPRSLIARGDIAFFSAYDSAHGWELWRADAQGAALVADLVPGPPDSVPRGLTPFAGGLLFAAALAESTSDDGAVGLWRSDGTAAGTRVIATLPGFPRHDRPFTAFRGALFFDVAPDDRRQLWRTDGTADGTALVRVFSADPGHDNDLTIAAAGDHLWVLLGPQASGTAELWRSDGTAAGTVPVRAFHPITEWDGVSFSDAAMTGGGSLVFAADDGTGVEPWRSDGTPAGTTQLVEINPGATDIFDEYAGLYPSFADLNGTLVFLAHDHQTNRHLWKSDATENGTHSIAALGRPYYTTFLAPVGGRLYFTVDIAEAGPELWELPSLDSPTRLLADIYPGPNGSLPSLLATLDGELIIAAYDGVHGNELWAPYGEGLIADIEPGPGDSYPHEPALLNGSLYFLAGGGLWRTDGTPGGTASIAALQAGYYARMMGGADRLAILVPAPEGGAALWYSDGTTEGTRRVADLASFPDPLDASESWPRLLAFTGRSLLFAAGDGEHGFELWRSDGSAESTHLVRDIHPGPVGSYPTAAVGRRGAVVLFADDGAHGREPWITDGTASGTHLLADLQPGALGSRARFGETPALIGDVFVFAASDGTRGLELWRSDGTASGTGLLQDIVPGSRSSSPRHFIRSGDHLFFTANDNVHGRELWALPLRDVGCMRDCPDARTPTPTPRRTPRPIWTPGPPLPTLTATATALPRTESPPPPPRGRVLLEIGSSAGAPGDRVQIGVTLRTDGLPVAGIQLDLVTGDALRLAGGVAGRPDCGVNPDIGKSASVLARPGPDGSTLRAIVIALDNTDPIPNGSVLFTCTYEIAPDAAPGSLPVRCQNALGSTPTGEPIAPANQRQPGSVGELVCADGEVSVEAPSGGPMPTPTGTPPAACFAPSGACGSPSPQAAEGDEALRAAPAGSGCQIGSDPAPALSLILLLPAALVLKARRGGSRGGRRAVAAGAVGPALAPPCRRRRRAALHR